MGRLFWKFFVAFWFSLVAAGAVIATGVWLARWFELVPPGREDTARLEFVLGTARPLLESGQFAILRQLAHEVDKQELGLVPFVLDANGQDLLGKPMDPDLWARVRQSPSILTFAEAQEGIGAVERVRTPDQGEVTVFIPAGSLRSLAKRPPSRALVFATVLLIACVFGAMASWYVARPVRTLRWALGRMADGAFDTRVQPLMRRRRDELAELGRDFDRMAQQVQGLMRSQKHLLHDVSHELRSPLARMQAAIGIARQQPERTQAMLDQVERDSGRLDELVGELLTLARIEANAGTEQTAPVDVVGVLAEICADARFEAQAAGRDLSLVAEGQWLATVSLELIYRALENVIRNAVKFTAPGTCVAVSCAEDEQGLSIEVSDHGPGVPSAQLDRIFEPFARADGASAEGFGLGLTIAKRAIEAHRGQIHALPSAQGGLAIRIRLPSAPGSGATLAAMS